MIYTVKSGDVMNFNLNYSSGIPMYEQIKEGIKHEIFSGNIKNNDPLPSVRQLARDLDVSMITTKRAYMELEHDGLIYTISGKGTFAKVNDFDIIISERNKQILSGLEEQLNNALNAGIPRKDVISMVEKVYEE